MSRFDADRLDDILAAIEAIRSHVARGRLSDDLVSDAVRIRLVEIGEAVKSIGGELLATEPAIPWKQIARMRDHLAHRYFMTEFEIIQDTIDNDLDPLVAAVERMRATLSPEEPGAEADGAAGD